MKVTALGIAVLAGALSLAACEKNEPGATTNTAPSSRPAPGKNADNTAQNRRDRDKDATTPMDQGESKEAVRITAEIRKALLDDTGLSANAHNVKIVTDKAGNVTLRGVVDSQSEKDSIEQKAKSVAGVSGVTNELEVKNGG